MFRITKPAFSITLMKKYTAVLILLLMVGSTQAQRNDTELNRDSILDWRYLVNASRPAASKPIKDDNVPGSSYTVWQQQAAAMLFNWVQQSYRPRGLVIRNLLTENQQWWLSGAPALHSYGIQLAGFAAHFVNGKLDLRCCEIGHYLGLAFNGFPGDYLQGGFNPDGLYLFAEQAQFSTGDTDDKLKSEGIDRQILPHLHPYRTYLDHYHDDGKGWNRVGVVVTKNGEWPFKPVLVKDAVEYINRQLATYPGIAQKNPFAMDPVKKALERLKPYYNEATKLKEINFYNAMLKDESGHAILDPRVIINGLTVNKTFPEYRMLVSASRQIIEQSKTDNPLWLYMTFSRNSEAVGNPTQFDPKFSTERDYLVNTLLRNFNFEYASNWLSQPEKMKSVAYTPVNAPATSSGNTITAPAGFSATAASKNKDAYTILYEDFDGYPTGTFSAKGWHTYGRGGHSFENATLNTVGGQTGKWISIPDLYTFYPDFTKPLPASFTVNYDVYFGSTISNKRTPLYFRLDTYDNSPKKSNPIDMHDINRNGFQFALALSGEAETSKRYTEAKYDEVTKTIRVTGLKANEATHVSVSVNGSSLTITVNGKEVMRDDTALPAGKTFKRYGWYCGQAGIYLSNIYVKSGTPVQSSNPQEPQFAGVVKDPNAPTGTAATFESAPYTFTPLPKLDKLPALSYPTGFKSSMPALPASSNKAAAALKIDYKFPERSAALGSISNTVVSADGFKKMIGDIYELASKKLQQANSAKIDSYLQSKKINTSATISKLAVDAWLESKPTTALYLFCKALQTDYTDLRTANNLASLLITYGYAEKAIPLLLYINKQTGGAPEALSNLASAYYNLGDPATAISFAEKCIVKDSLNATANKVAAFAHLNKAAQSSGRAETEKAMGYLKQALKSGYNKEASDILSKIESNHQKTADFANTNFKEFPLLKRIQLPAMPEDLHQMKSFNDQLELEKSALSKTKDEIFAAARKIPQPNLKQMTAAASQNKNVTLMITKAAAIINQTSAWYLKMKADLEQVFKLDKKALDDKHNEKMKAIGKKYLALLNKLEGGEGNAEEEEEIERLMRLRCEEYNKESAAYLSDVAKLTNQFAQRSEHVSRIYCRDYANWMPVQLLDNSNRFFLEAQRIYLTDIGKILSLYTAVEPCIYPTEQAQKEKTTAKPKQWEELYCANVKGSLGLGPAKISFNCTSMSISGGEGFVGEMNLNYNENGTFKDVTIGAGVGAEWHTGKKEIATASIGASALEYLTIGAGADGSLQVTDWGISAGASVSGSIDNGALGEEINIASITVGFISGDTSIGGAVPDALRLK